MDNMTIYRQAQAVPQNAQKTIGGGRLKGMTDINPMWRIMKLTELFGPCGIGWKYTIDKQWMEISHATNEIAGFCNITLYIKDGDKWSEGIPGTGGSAFLANEKNGPYMSDEVYKMALTDALSVACKALGFGADVYWMAGRSKYTKAADEPQTGNSAPPPANRPPASGEFVPICAGCGAEITDRVHDFSVKKYGKPLCMDCQRKQGAAS